VPGEFILDYRDADGVRHAVQFSGTLNAALILERQILKDEGKLKPTQQTTFTGLCAYYESLYSGQRYWRAKKWIVARLRKEFEGQAINVLTTEQFKRYRAKLESSKYIPAVRNDGSSPESKPYSIATVNRYMACLRHMIREAVDAGMCDGRVLESVKKAKQKPERNRRLRYIETQAEAERLLDACQENKRAPHLFPIVLMALHTGMRKGELLHLRWHDVDISNRAVTVRDAKGGQGRILPLSRRLCAVLSAMARPIDESAFVFPSKGGRAFQWTQKSFASACRKVNLRDFRFHDLRHTFASWHVMDGTPLATLQRLMGHKTIAMTMRYSHLSPDHMKIATRLFDSPSKDNALTFR
jgi:integrase